MIERVLIADDEPLARERIEALVRAHAPAAQIRSAGDGNTAVRLINEWAPHAVLLDIQMPGKDGFEVVEAVGVTRMPLTVFATAYDAHAMRAFNAAAVDYLLKPFDEERFAVAWQRVARLHAASVLAHEAQALGALLHAARGSDAPSTVVEPPSRPNIAERFMVRKGERTIVVPVSEIRFLQSDGNYVELRTAQGTHVMRETMAHVEERLDPTKFVRIHRRVIVAIEFIKELQPWFGGDQILVLKDGSKLRVSRTRREAVASRLAGLG
jgi:two-component system LytT family response regulator